MSEDHTAEREAFEAWYSAEDQETDDPERTYELTEEGMNELTKYCVWQGWQARAAAQAQQPWQYTPPAQERIQALELEVRQLTEQIAELRHAPTPQADSQPAPVREGEWINDAGRIKWLMWRVQDLEAKLAARAPADSVLEDAETALRKVLGVVQRYLPPDGPSAHDAMSEIIAIVDPWPLGPLEKP